MYKTIKKITFIFIISQLFINVLSAQKHDYHWIMGYDSNTPDTTFSVVKFDFNSSKLYWEKFNTKYDFGTATFNMSDSAGNLQFYSNGCWLINNKDEIMKNGDTLNPGKTYQNRCTIDHDTYGSFFNFLCIPKPKSINKYLLFHHSDTLMKFNGGEFDYDYAFKGLNYSEIDMEMEQGLGAVTKKRVTIFNDILLPGNMVATKHSNNNDWWILAKKSHSNIWHKILVTNDTIRWVSKQNIGKFDDTKGSGSGQYCFSKNGKRFATYNMTEQVQVFDFDRSTGELSNPIYLDLQDSIQIGGCAFSPSGRFLYVSNTYKVFQFDLEQNNIQNTKTKVGEWDGFLHKNFWPTYLTWIFHGPDCKLYLNTWGSTRYMHVINYPDNKGIECNLVQRAIVTKSLNSETPKFPHFRTGTPMENFCDTLTTDSKPIIYFTPEVLVYPNPATDNLKIEILGLQTWDWGVFRMFDTTGKEIWRKNLRSEEEIERIDITNFPSGLYEWTVTLDHFGVKSGKVIIGKN